MNTTTILNDPNAIDQTPIEKLLTQAEYTFEHTQTLRMRLQEKMERNLNQVLDITYADADKASADDYIAVSKVAGSYTSLLNDIDRSVAELAKLHMKKKEGESNHQIAQIVSGILNSVDVKDYGKALMNRTSMPDGMADGGYNIDNISGRDNSAVDILLEERAKNSGINIRAGELLHDRHIRTDGTPIVPEETIFSQQDNF